MDYKFNDSRTPLELFHAGDSVRAYEFMGAHRVNWDNRDGVVFRVWAPNALSVSVVMILVDIVYALFDPRIRYE